MSIIVVLTGELGSGKSTALIRAVNLLKSRGLLIGGVTSREHRNEGTRVGFDLEDIATGNRGVLASLTTNVGPRLGRYRVNLRDLSDIAATALISTIKGSDVIVCDEIGPMELLSPEFRRAVKAILESRKPLIVVVHKKLNDPAILDVKNSPRSLVFDVNEENRDSLPNMIEVKIVSSIDHD